MKREKQTYWERKVSQHHQKSIKVDALIAKEETIALVIVDAVANPLSSTTIRARAWKDSIQRKRHTVIPVPNAEQRRFL